jgi:hypothetical protein
MMNPVYAVFSWLSILYTPYSLYFNMLRDSYESYALYIFFCLLIAYVQSADPDGRPIEMILSKDPPKSHPAPFCCLPQVVPGAMFVLWMKRMILQYTLVKPFFSFLAIVLHVAGYYHEGKRLTKQLLRYL